jgi:hypothetical protein
MKTIAFHVSSRTGNTRKIAEAARQRMEEFGWTIEEVTPGKPVESELVAVCFWCFKSSFDPISLALVQSLEDKRILAFGTMGGYPDSPYAERVLGKVTADIGDRNTLEGLFLSQGKVRADNIEKRRRLPEDDPHHLDDAGVARVLESQKHPNEQDLARAVAFVNEHLG